MLIRRSKTKTLRPVIALSVDDHERLERVKNLAEKQGFDIDLEGALAAYISKLVKRAEQELQVPGVASPQRSVEPSDNRIDGVD